MLDQVRRLYLLYVFRAQVSADRHANDIDAADHGSAQAGAIDLQWQQFFDDFGGRFWMSLGQIVAKASEATFTAAVAAVPGKAGNATLFDSRVILFRTPFCRCALAGGG
jgi:hypothetical protein